MLHLITFMHFHYAQINIAKHHAFYSTVTQFFPDQTIFLQGTWLLVWFATKV